jgi:uncharacterized protein (TIGR02996 family)
MPNNFANSLQQMFSRQNIHTLSEPKVVHSVGLPNGDMEDLREAVAKFTGHPVTEEHVKKLFRIHPNNEVHVGSDDRRRLKMSDHPVFSWGPMNADPNGDEDNNTFPEQHEDDQHVISVQTADKDGPADTNNPHNFSHVYMYRDREGRVRMYTNYLSRPAGSRHPSGSKQMMDLLDTAKEVGVAGVHMNAYTRPPDYKGSAVWPLMGFNDSIPEDAKKRLPPELSHCTSMSHLILSEGGEKFWKDHIAANPQHNDDWASMRHAEFDLHPNSISNRLLEQYRGEYNRRKAPKAPQAPAAQPEPTTNPPTGEHSASVPYARRDRRTAQAGRRLPPHPLRRGDGQPQPLAAGGRSQEGEAGEGAVRVGTGEAYAAALSKAIKYSQADEESFHNAIKENPESELHNLVYADWLQENDRPASAHFIRKSVEAGRTGVRFNYDAVKPTLGVIRDGSNLHLMLRLPSANSKSGLGWWLNFPHPDDIKAHAVGLAAEGVDVPKGLLPKPEKKVEAEGAVQYAVDATEFHKSISENTNDHLNHLAFADWLQENDRPAHAEVIRRAVEHSSGGVHNRVYMSKSAPLTQEAEYAVHALDMSLPHFDDHWHVDLAHQKPDENGNHIVWSVGPVAKDDAHRLIHSLVAEGAAPDAKAESVVNPVDPNTVDLSDAADGPLPADLYAADDRPVKYAAVPSHDIHPDYQPTGVAPRVGSVLNELAKENSDGGLLAEGVLRTGDHSVLPILADYLDEAGHPHKDTFDWRHLPRAIGIDKAVDGVFSLGKLSPKQRLSSRSNPIDLLACLSRGERYPLSRSAFTGAASKVDGGVKWNDVLHSVVRLAALQLHKRYGLPVDSPHLMAVVNGYKENVGLKDVDPHRYPDTRPANKRLYRLIERVRKYGAYKAPTGGLVVKESPLAVTGTFASGGSFVTDLTELPAPPPEKPKITLSQLIKRLRRRA